MSPRFCAVPAIHINLHTPAAGRSRLKSHAGRRYTV